MKLPFTFALKFILRLVLPGFLLSIIFMPTIKLALRYGQISIPDEYAYVGGTLIFGWIIILADMHIYMLFEGRRYWPERIKELFENSEKRRLSRLLEKERLGDHLRQTASTRFKGDRMFREAGTEIRRFPIDGNYEPIVKSPTRLGNLIFSYEEYPRVVYGISSIFYWPRILYLLDKDGREDIDNQQALVDSSVYVSFCLIVGAFMSAVYAMVKLIALSIGIFPEIYFALSDIGFLLFMAGFSLAAAYGVYRFSMHSHAQFGDAFKATFDQFADKLPISFALRQIVEITGNDKYNKLNDREKFGVVWHYLANYRIRDVFLERPRSNKIGDYPGKKYVIDAMITKLSSAQNLPKQMSKEPGGNCEQDALADEDGSNVASIPEASVLSKRG